MCSVSSLEDESGFKADAIGGEGSIDWRKGGGELTRGKKQHPQKEEKILIPADVKMTLQSLFDKFKSQLYYNHHHNDLMAGVTKTWQWMSTPREWNKSKMAVVHAGNMLENRCNENV